MLCYWEYSGRPLYWQWWFRILEAIPITSTNSFNRWQQNQKYLRQHRNRSIKCFDAEEYSELSRTSKKQLFAKILESHESFLTTLWMRFCPTNYQLKKISLFIQVSWKSNGISNGISIFALLFLPLKIQIQRIKAQLIPSTTNIQYLKEAALTRFNLANNLKIYFFLRG